VTYVTDQDEPAPIPEEYSPDLQRLVTVLLSKDPGDRPGAAEVLALPFIRRHCSRLAATGGTVGQRVQVPKRTPQQDRAAR
jgi:hypothetical protein